MTKLYPLLNNENATRVCMYVCVRARLWRRYEEGHGLVDAVQFQKRLKNDLHRLETELEQRSLKVRSRDESHTQYRC